MEKCANLKTIPLFEFFDDSQTRTSNLDYKD
jgi:hypothetical protein